MDSQGLRPGGWGQAVGLVGTMPCVLLGQPVHMCLSPQQNRCVLQRS